MTAIVVRTGRPTSCTPERLEAVVKRIDKAAPIKLACEAEGVPRQTLELWTSRAEAGEEPYATFLAEVTRARARYLAGRCEKISDAGDELGSDGDWKANQFLVERGLPEEFAPSLVLLEKAQDTVIDALVAALRDRLSPAAWAEVAPILGQPVPAEELSE
ncbi:MAG: hypothetical protein WC211_00755 [Dehalococcoidia bacterium]|jgi:hypothetical protein